MRGGGEVVDVTEDSRCFGRLLFVARGGSSHDGRRFIGERGGGASVC